jgi:hypothetical protein
MFRPPCSRTPASTASPRSRRLVARQRGEQRVDRGGAFWNRPAGWIHRFGSYVRTAFARGANAATNSFALHQSECRFDRITVVVRNVRAQHVGDRMPYAFRSFVNGTVDRDFAVGTQTDLAPLLSQIEPARDKTHRVARDLRRQFADQFDELGAIQVANVAAFASKRSTLFELGDGARCDFFYRTRRRGDLRLCDRR